MNNPAWKVRCLSAPGTDTDMSLFVNFDTIRLLFGAGEGAQRTFLQKGQSFKYMEAVFLPDGATGRGGLPGIVMSTADSGMKSLKIIGPPDTAHFMSTFRSCVMRTDSRIAVTSHPRDARDEARLLLDAKQLKVHGVMLRPDEAASPPVASSMGPAGMDPATLEQWNNAILEDMFPAQTRPTMSLPGLQRPGYPDDRYPLPLPSDADVKTDMVYICQAATIRGKFDNEKAKALNVPGGSIRSKLTSGQAIEFDDPTAEGGKRTVRPEDILVGGGPGGICVIVHCREHNFERLVSSSAFAPYQTGVQQEHTVQRMVHRVDRSVWQDERYAKWMESFGETTDHIYADPTGNNETLFSSSAWMQLKLNSLNPDFFPPTHHVVDPLPEALKRPNVTVLSHDLQMPMHQYGEAAMRPRSGSDPEFPSTSEELAAAIEDLPNRYPEFGAVAQKARDAVEREAERRKNVPLMPGDDIVVTTLGTGSALPSKYRNVSSTHFDVPNWGGVLLDCGEGSLGQLRRRFGPDGLKQLYKDLRIIFISHMHADHHLGLANILRDRFQNGIHSTLYLISPHPIPLMLMENGAWQEDVPTEALENLKWVNAARLKKPWAAEDLQATEKAPKEPTEDLGNRQWAVGDSGRILSSGISSLSKLLADATPAAPQRLMALDDFDPRVSENQPEASASATTTTASSSDNATTVTPPDVAEMATEPATDMTELEVAAGKRKWPFRNIFRFAPTVMSRSTATITEMMTDLGLAEIVTPIVPHRGVCHGLVIEHKDGWKVVYSGDTQPSSALVGYGKGATILIHEATMEDDKADMAKAKAHSTFGQAIAVAQRMNAKYLVLNHFSQRYPKLPPSLSAFRHRSPSPNSVGQQSGSGAQPVVAITFDLQSMRAADMWKMAYYFDAIEIVFDDVNREDPDKVDPESSSRAEGKRGAKGDKKAKAPRASKPNGGNGDAKYAAPAPKKWGMKAKSSGDVAEPLMSEQRYLPTAPAPTSAVSAEEAAANNNTDGVAGTKRESSTPEAEPAAKRGRGRPRKNSVVQETTVDAEPVVKRGRGRPRKNSVVVEEDATMEA